MTAYDASFTFFLTSQTTNLQVVTVLVDVDECLCTNQDKWRLSYLKSLLEQKQVHHYLGDKEAEKTLTDLIHSLCIN